MKNFLDRYRERHGTPIDIRPVVLAIQILNQLKIMFAGKKTYIIGTLGILTAIGTYLAGMTSPMEALAAIFAAVQSMNLRSAITTASK